MTAHKGLSKKQKKQLLFGTTLLGLLLLWRIASAKPTGKVIIGPVTVEPVTEEDPLDPLREKRAGYRNRILDLIAFDEDAWMGTRRPTTADNILLDSLFASLASLRSQIPDPEGFDAGFDRDLLGLVHDARGLDPTSSSTPPVAFGSSRYVTRRLAIEETIRDLVAMGQGRQIRRKPTNTEMVAVDRMLAEYDALAAKLRDIDPEVELFDEPLREILRIARALPDSYSNVAPVSQFVPGTVPVA